MRNGRRPRRTSGASPRWQRVTLAFCVLVAALVLTPVSGRAMEADDEDASVVNVPTGITSVQLGAKVTQKIACHVLPNTIVRVEMTIMDGNQTYMSSLVVPKVVVFMNTNDTTAEFQSKQITLFGRVPGRFYLSYRLTGDTDQYRLLADSSVFVVNEGNAGWEGIWYELVLNLVFFIMGLVFFIWRRLHRMELPIWKGHQAMLFERANYDDLATEAYEKRYSEINGPTVTDRMKKFWNMSPDSAYVVETCGIPAALSLQFHKDAGNLFAILTFFSIAAMLPVNYLSGKSLTSIRGNSFQQTTFSNVPLHSNWYWVHVGYCYLVAACVIGFLVKQHALSTTLRRRTKRIIGGRSIFIRDGLPANMTSKRLRAILSKAFPDSITEVTVIQDLRKVHSILHLRRELSDKLDRMRDLDARYEHGALSWNLLLCPGSILVPSPSDICYSYATCRPCRYMYRHEQISQYCCPSHTETARPARYSSVKSTREIIDPKTASDIQSLDDELDFFPEEAIELYINRKCMGAAFVVFSTTAARNEFISLVREHTILGWMVNRAEDLSDCVRLGHTQEKVPASATGELAPHLSKLVLNSAPEPDDIIWTNLEYRPFSLFRIIAFILRQVMTLLLLLIFSSPTAVLVYIKLDSTSDIYHGLDDKHSPFTTLIATYLPSLLLIAVNWFLLAFLFYLTMLAPSFSESRRMKSFLVKGFTYLVLSSVFLPSIGVTAVYLAVKGFEQSGHQTYVESFLYKVSGTFFISYICQRTLLGSIVELTRCGERLVYQPWVLSRSMTEEEQKNAMKPWPYYFGHDYAMILSIFLVVLLGTVITPIITPFGALYFYVKFFTVKYNFLYVVPFTPGRGHVAQTAYDIAFVCLILFELTMAFVFLQVAGHKQFTAMLVLLSATGVFYSMRIAGPNARASRSKTEAPEIKRPLLPSPSFDPARMVAARDGLCDQPMAIAMYTDPYKVALSIFKLLGVNQFRHMSSHRTQLKYAFYRLKRHAKRTRTGFSPTASSSRLSRRSLSSSSSERNDIVGTIEVGHSDIV